MAKTKETPALTPKIIEASDFQSRIYGPVQRDRHQIFSGRLANPDPVVKQFGSWSGLAIYSSMRRNHAWLNGISKQRIDRVLARERRIVPGDPSDSTSIRMADDFRRFVQNIPRKDTVFRKLLDGMFTGIRPAEKVYGQDPRSGLLGPVKIFDVPPEAIKFGEKGEDEIYFCSVTRPDGELVENPRKFMFFRWGSTWTPYGEGEFQSCYLPAWYIEQIIEMMLQSVEDFGKPTAWVQIPSVYDTEQWNAVVAGVRSTHKNFIATPWDQSHVNVSFPTVNVTSSGTAGRAETEAIRYFVGWCYIDLLGAQQTQDKTGGSRALEDTRDAITDDKTPTASDALDEILTLGVADDVGELNWPNQPRELWPRFESEPLPAEDLKMLHGFVEQGIDRGIDYSLEWYHRKFGLERRKDGEEKLGFPQSTRVMSHDLTEDPEAEGFNAEGGEGEEAA